MKMSQNGSKNDMNLLAQSAQIEKWLKMVGNPLYFAQMKLKKVQNVWDPQNGQKWPDELPPSTNDAFLDVLEDSLSRKIFSFFFKLGNLSIFCIFSGVHTWGGISSTKFRLCRWSFCFLLSYYLHHCCQYFGHAKFLEPLWCDVTCAGLSLLPSLVCCNFPFIFPFEYSPHFWP